MITTVLGTAVLSTTLRHLKEDLQERGSEGFDVDSIKLLTKEKPELLDIESCSSEWKDRKRADVDDIIKELRNSAADTAAEEQRNLESFERKVLLKVEEMKSAVQEIVGRESDRVISTITAVVVGPRGIIDKVIPISLTRC